jgi:uncharacterized membrane protein
MIVAADLLAPSIVDIIKLLCLVILVLAVWFAPWRKLLASNARQHLFFGSILVLCMFWLLNIRMLESLWLHPLLLTATTLLLGWSLAVLAGTLAQLLLLLFGVGTEEMLALNVFLTTIVPASVSYIAVTISRRIPLQNLYIYMLGAGFLGAIFSVAALTLVFLLLLALSDQQALLASGLQQAPLILMLMFPEGFLNGTIVTALTVYRPELVKTFDEEFYLKRQR